MRRVRMHCCASGLVREKRNLSRAWQNERVPMRTAAHPAGPLRFRWLVYELVLRDLRLRYRGSVLGFAWTLLNPLLFMLVYTLVFAVFLKMGTKNYPVYVLAGMIAWNWFATAVSQGTSAILDGRMYVGRSVFPMKVLPLIPVLSNGVNFVLSLPLLLVLMALYHVHFGPALLALPLIVAVEFLFILGVVMLSATYNVFYRDLQQLISYVLTALFFLTPIFYPRDHVSARFQAWFAWNPIAGITGAFQSVMYEGRFPNWAALGYALFCAIVVATLGFGAFARHRESFGQYL